MSDIIINQGYDVAFSFAGAQRDYVEKVKNELSKYKVSVFYDNDNIVDLWGKNLYQYLAEIYSENSKYCVIFISKEYKERPWTNHEFQFASERVFDNYGKPDMREYILPVIFDDTKIPGLLRSILHIDARNTTPEKLAEFIAEKVGKSNATVNEEYNIISFFEHIEAYLNSYVKQRIDIQIKKESNILNISYEFSDIEKNIITFQLFDDSMNLYIGEFGLGVNPSATIFINNNTLPLIKLINFSTYFKKLPEQNLSLNEFDDCLRKIISTLSEETL